MGRGKEEKLLIGEMKSLFDIPPSLSLPFSLSLPSVQIHAAEEVEHGNSRGLAATDRQPAQQCRLLPGGHPRGDTGLHHITGEGEGREADSL